MERARPEPQALHELVGLAEVLAASCADAGHRLVLGITGAPGAGKSTLAGAIVDALGPRAVLVPMDGFHLANSELERLGRRHRKGAPDTFDATGFVHLLDRLRHDRVQTVYAPAFDRNLEEPVAGSIPVGAEVSIVVTEGNYLLLDGPWAPARTHLDSCWYVEIDDVERRARLARRHEQFGKSAEESWRWALGSDEINAAAVRASRERADRVVTLG
jgi:pantothenate kinase